MAARIFYQEDCNLSVLEGQKIAIIGYGSQGHAHALNLKESGCDAVSYTHLDVYKRQLLLCSCIHLKNNYFFSTYYRLFL